MQLLLLSIRAAAHTTANRMAKENFPFKYMIAKILEYLLNLSIAVILIFRISLILTSEIFFYIGYHWF